jgi:hypothetical protein
VARVHVGARRHRLRNAAVPQPQAYGEIYAYRIADAATVRVTHNRWEDGAPSWEKGLPR